MRLFVAITPQTEVHERIARVVEELKPLSREPRWLRRDGFHLTLKFIGDVEAAKLDAIGQALGTVSMPTALTIQFRAIGFFPSRERPRVVWCGAEGSAGLAALAQRISDLLLPIGIPPETRAFAPHITLARVPAGKHVDNLVRAADDLRSYDFGTMHVAEFHLFESFLKPSGAEYKRIETFRFAKESL